MRNSKANKYGFLTIVSRYVASCDTDVFVKLIIEPLTLPLTWMILNYTSIEANQLTYTGLMAGLSGSLLAGLSLNLGWLIAGFLIFYVCDFMDGPVASINGGGTYFGTRLDFVTDRSVFLFAALTMGWYHYKMDDAESLMLLLLYYSSFTLLDLFAFSSLTAKVKFNRLPPAPVSEAKSNTWLKSFLNPWVWIPSRLSSYILAILAYLLTEEFSVVYCVALVCTGCDYLRAYKGSLKKILSHIKSRMD